MKRVGVVTGASEGIGQEFARQLSKKGVADEWWLIARREERLAALAAELSPVPCRIFPLDLSAPGSLAPLAAALAEGPLSVSYAVAAAGFGKIGPFEEVSAAAARGMIDLNCAALTELLHLVLPYAVRGTRLVTVASAAAFLPQPRFAVYAATKAYVLHLSRALSCELRGRGVTVTALCPGPVATGFFRVAEETGKMAAGKELFMAQAPVVVRRAIRAAERGKPVCVPTPSMRLGRLAAKLLPHGLLVRFFG